VSTLRSGVEELRSEDVAGVPDAALEEDLGELLAVSDQLESEILRRLAAVDRRRSFERDGHLSTVSWLSARFRMSRVRAAELTRLARAMEQAPAVRRALGSEEITSSEVRVLAQAHGAHPEAFGQAEELLVEAARSLPVHRLQQAVGHWKQAVDDRQGVGDEDLRSRRGLHASPTVFGMVRVDGDLDPECGECVLTALRAVVDAEARSGAGGEDRTGPQRMADALHEICRSFLDRGDRPAVAGERPHVAVVVDLRALAGTGEGRCELDHAGPVPPRWLAAWPATPR
jgi:hypothetical protein